MIPVAWRANVGYLFRHPWQLALAMLGIAVGVAVIVAVDLANASARKAFLLSMDTVTGRATHQVIGGPRGVDERAYVALRRDHGFHSIAPVVQGTVVVAERQLQLLGIDLFAEREVRAFTLDADTTRPDGSPGPQSFFRAILVEPGAVAMSAGLAESLGVDAGDTFDVTASGYVHEARLAGYIGGASAVALDNLVISDIATAQAWLGKAGYLTRIDVRAPYGDDAFLDRLKASLPADLRVLSAAGRTRNTADLSSAFMTNLTAMSLLALLVGLFLIYNSVSFSVLQRRGLIGILRALGVTRRQVMGLVLGEAALTGLVAGAAGVIMGVFLGEQLLALVSRSINDFYFRVSVTDVSIDGYSVAKGMVAGIGAAVFAAFVPALEATSYAPRLAMTRSAIEVRSGRLLPRVATAGVLLMLSAGLVMAFSGRDLVAGLTAVFMLILGFALCMPLVVRRLSTWLTPLAGRVGGMLARVAVSGISASLSRTGVAIVALAVAVSATIGVTVMVDSFRGSVSAWLGQTLQADVYAGVQRGSMDPALIADILDLDPVIAHSSSRRTMLEDERGGTQLLVIDMAPGAYAGTEILDADPDSVWASWEDGDVILVSEPYGYRHNVTQGDTVTLRTDAGDRPFRVAATYQSYDINATAVLMSRRSYDRHWNDPGIDSIGLYLAPGTDVPAFIADVERLARGRQVIRVNSNVRIRELSLDVFDRTFIVTDVLYWLAVGVALIGILGAMLALELERGRELATLRALGMTPGQVGGLVTMQTGFIGLLSGLAAIPLGLVMAYVLIEVINRRAFGWQIGMVVAPGTLVSSLAFSIAVALLAGIYPAWLATRSQPAIAMREE